jgi:hypothetical protein
MLSLLSSIARSTVGTLIPGGQAHHAGLRVWASLLLGVGSGAWDPKEGPGPLIALLGYLAILHGRMIGWFKDFGTRVGCGSSVTLGVLMAW